MPQFTKWHGIQNGIVHKMVQYKKRYTQNFTIWASCKFWGEAKQQTQTFVTWQALLQIVEKNTFRFRLKKIESKVLHG